MRSVHLVRSFLARTETFIYLQLTHLRKTEAFVLTRTVKNRELFPYTAVMQSKAHLRGAPATWADVSYRCMRRASAHERRFFVQAVQQLRPDLLHAHFAVDAAYFAYLKSYLNVPLIISCYGYDVSRFPNQYLGLGNRYLGLAWKHADIVLAMSNDMRSDLIRIGCPSEKIFVHYYGVDLTRFGYIDRSSSPRRTRLMQVGALTERKGGEYTLRAFAEVVRKMPEIELRFVGAGPMRSRLEQLALTLGVSDRVSFSGFVKHEDIAKELAGADIFCHPSITMPNGDKEGIPGTVVEAMATGLPVVTTRHAGIPEIVQNGEHGFVVGEQDTDGLVEALSILAQNPDLRRKFGLAAASHAAQCADARRQTAELENIYRSAASIAKPGNS